MTKSAFTEFWCSLSSALSTKASDDAKLFLLYFDEARSVPDENADRMLRQILRECEFFPKLAKFCEYCGDFSPRKKQGEPIKNKDACYFCMNTGVITDELHGDRNRIFICSECEVGRALKKPYFTFYVDRYGKEALEEVKQENLRFKAEIGDPREYFFKMMNKWGTKQLTVDS